MCFHYIVLFVQGLDLSMMKHIRQTCHLNRHRNPKIQELRGYSHLLNKGQVKAKEGPLEDNVFRNNSVAHQGGTCWQAES